MTLEYNLQSASGSSVWRGILAGQCLARESIEGEQLHTDPHDQSVAG